MKSKIVKMTRVNRLESQVVFGDRNVHTQDATRRTVQTKWCRFIGFLLFICSEKLMEQLVLYNNEPVGLRGAEFVVWQARHRLQYLL